MSSLTLPHPEAVPETAPETVLEAEPASRTPASRCSDLTTAVRARESARSADDRYLLDQPALALLTPWALKVLEDADALNAPLEAVVVRARFGDDTLTAALDAGVRQVVGLSVGSDTRMWRTPHPQDVSYFETDLPGELDGKGAHLAEAGFALNCEYRAIGVDLLGNWLPALEAAGHDPARPTCWILEGLTWYFDHSQCDRLLQQLTDRSAPGSWITADIPAPAFATDPALQDFHVRMRELGTPVVGAIAAPDQWLAAHGWQNEAYSFDEICAGDCPTLPRPPARLRRDLPLVLARGRI